MKKKLAILLAVAFAFTLCTATVAYAAPEGNGNQGGNIEDRIGKAQERLTFLETIQPMIGQMQENRGKIQSLSLQLREQVKLARAHVVALNKDIDNLSEEQLEALKALKLQLHECRLDLVQTNVNMRQIRNQIQNGRRNRNYEAIENAYGAVIKIQERRMEILQDMIQLNEQICEV